MLRSSGTCQKRKEKKKAINTTVQLCTLGRSKEKNYTGHRAGIDCLRSWDMSQSCICNTTAFDLAPNSNHFFALVELAGWPCNYLLNFFLATSGCPCDSAFVPVNLIRDPVGFTYKLTSNARSIASTEKKKGGESSHYALRIMSLAQ
jgi:hypothetical protein